MNVFGFNVYWLPLLALFLLLQSLLEGLVQRKPGRPVPPRVHSCPSWAPFLLSDVVPTLVFLSLGKSLHFLHNPGVTLVVPVSRPDHRPPSIAHCRTFVVVRGSRLGHRRLSLDPSRPRISRGRLRPSLHSSFRFYKQLTGKRRFTGRPSFIRVVILDACKFLLL